MSYKSQLIYRIVSALLVYPTWTNPWHAVVTLRHVVVTRAKYNIQSMEVKVTQSDVAHATFYAAAA